MGIALRHRLGLAACLLGSLACGSPEPIRLEIEPPEGSRSAVVVIDELDSGGACLGLRSATLLDLSAQPPMRPPALEGYAGEPLAVNVYFTPDSPEALGVAAGPIAGRPSAEGCWTPPGAELHRARLGDGEVGGFTRVDAEAERGQLCACLAGPASDCRPYGVRITRLGSRGPNFMLPLDAHRFVVSMGAYLVFTFDTRTETATEWSLPPGFPAGSILPLAGGEYWFGGRDGALWRGRLEPSLSARAVSASSEGGELGWLAGPPDGSALYSLSYAGVLEAYRPSEDAWSVLHRFPNRPASEACGGLLLLPSGELLAARGSSGRLVSLHEGRLQEILISELNGLCALTQHPELGVLLTTSDGQILQRTQDGRWVELGRTGLTQGIFSLAPRGSGFVFAGQRGFYGEWEPRGGFCQRMETISPVAPGDVFFALPLQSEVFLFGTGVANEVTNAITRITP